MHTKTRLIIIAAVLALVGVTSAWGLSLEPLTHVFSTTTAGRVHTYRVTNTQDREIAVRIRVTTREHRADGSEIRSDASNQWLVFPTRMTLAPGQTQSVRVQYTGAAGIERERAFRIIAEQLPINISEGEQRSGINVLFRYEASAYVREGRFSPDVLLANAERRFDNGDFRGILVRFENRGNTHAILHNLVLRLILTDESGATIDRIELREEDLPVLGGRNLLAGLVLEELITVPEPWTRGNFNVQYDVDLLD